MNDRPFPPNARFIPKNANLVFKGTIFDVYHWEQEMFDGTYETFEMLKRPDTIRVIAIDGNEIITVDEEQPAGVSRVRSVPAGRVDPSDASPLEGAKREMREETGLEFADWRLFEVIQPEPKMEWFIYTYVAQQKTGEYTPKLDAGEKIIVGRSSFGAMRDANVHAIPGLLYVHSLEELLASLEQGPA